MANPSNDSPGLLPTRNVGDYNNLMFIINQAIASVNTLSLVQIISCTNDGELNEVGFVDVLPLVNQIDSQGNPTPHKIIYNLPYMRIQGGSSAVIIDPKPGDIGVAGFCSRDISKVKYSKKQDNPGSRRKHSFSDGVYLFGVRNGAPTQYIIFNDDGITLKSPNEIKIEAPTVKLNGDIEINGTIKQDGVDLAKLNHTHAVSGSSTGPGLP